MIVLDTDISKAKQPKKLPTVITSFNEEYYKRCGKEFVETFKQYWSPSIRLVVYYEGESSSFEMINGVSWRPIEEVEFLADYLDSLRFPIQHGIVGDRFDMWFDARQARKAFMEMYAMKKYGGKVFWLDADIVTHAHVPEDFLDRMLPDDKFNCFMGRDGWYHTESGFIGFNADHPIASRFAKNYLHTFITGVIFASLGHGRPCWNDCGGFDAVRHLMGNGDEFVNLAKDLPEGVMHPQANLEMAKYFLHFKGARKDTKTLQDGDIIKNGGHHGMDK